MGKIFEIVWGILINSFDLLKDMAPYLLLGFFVAGILHEFISAELIAKHLGKSSFGSVLKAAIFGIPLPLCSCGVIPPTMALRKAGASKGSVLSFLIATPTSGVDSIAATYSLLGPFFAAYRVGASFFAAIFSGVAANILDKTPDTTSDNETKTIAKKHKNIASMIKDVFYYSFVELLGEIAKWLVIGILIGGMITYLLPDSFFGGALQPGIVTIILMVVVSIPIYVCATGSIPIAAALLMKGLNPGAAFVFLLAGPATNSVTITVISKFLGKKSTIIYLATLVLSSVGFGLLLDVIWVRMGFSSSMLHQHQHQLLPNWLEWSLALLLVALLAMPPIIKIFTSNKSKNISLSQETDMQSTLIVPGMTCNNCMNHVKSAVESVDGVDSVTIDLKSKKVDVSFQENIDRTQLIKAIENSGYDVQDG